jgi:NAD(P)-dependent dehydrogenase (short-subunit alcohol dehydrogenase family)
MTSVSELVETTAQRIAVVTGAAAGVGLATVEALREDGFVVVGLDLTGAPAALEADADVEWVQGDVATQETWDRVVEAVEARQPHGADCLVAAAADMVVEGFLETPPEDFARLFEVNALGALRGMRTLMPAMIERGRGSIAVVCSVDSLYTELGLSAYSASKAALLQIVRAAAVEHSADGLRINAVCPGAIDTALFQRAIDLSEDPEAERAAAISRIPAGVVLRPGEVASVLRFLVSDAASGLSGAAIAVDGGLTATYDFDGGAR